MHHTKFILDCCLSFFLPPLCKCLSIFLSFFLSSSCISLFFFCTDLSPSFFVFRCSFYQKLSCLQLHALTLTINSFHLFAFLCFSLHFFDIFNTASVPIMCKLSSHPLRIPFLPSWSFSLPNSSLFTSVVHLLSFFPYTATVIYALISCYALVMHRLRRGRKEGRRQCTGSEARNPAAPLSITMAFQASSRTTFGGNVFIGRGRGGNIWRRSAVGRREKNERIAASDDREKWRAEMAWQKDRKRGEREKKKRERECLMQNFGAA